MGYVVFGDLRSGAFAAEMALAEAGAAYEFHTVSLEKNEQLSPHYLALNPSGKLPALKLPGGEIVTESAAILLAIADRFPEAGLLPPPGSFARAQAYRWIAYMASEIYPMVEITDYPERFAPKGEQAEALRQVARERARARLLIIENAIAGPWLLPTGFSAADIYAAMFSCWSIGQDWRKANLPKLVAMGAAFGARPTTGEIWQRHFGYLYGPATS